MGQLPPPRVNQAPPRGHVAVTEPVVAAARPIGFARHRKRVPSRTTLEPRKLVTALEALAAQLGIPVRYDALSQGPPRKNARSIAGGLCKVRGEPLILIDQSVPPPDRVAVLAQALAQFDLSGVEVPPLVRAVIRRYGKNAHRPRPLARTSGDRSGRERG